VVGSGNFDVNFVGFLNMRLIQAVGSAVALASHGETRIKLIKYFQC
jgi:hypothetical protein